MSSKLLLVLFVPLLCMAQERALIKGRVVSGSLGIKNTLLVNFSAQAETNTDSLGYFTIKAKTGDLLIAAAYNIEEKKIRYTPDLVQGGILIIETDLLAAEIEEVVINRSNITAESLGLVPKGQKKYTTWERRRKPEGIIIERKEKLIEDIKGIYSPEEITEIFKIPDELINGFLYYVADDGGLASAIKRAQPEIIKFILSNMAVQYLKLQKE